MNRNVGNVSQVWEGIIAKHQNSLEAKKTEGVCREGKNVPPPQLKYKQSLSGTRLTLNHECGMESLMR